MRPSNALITSFLPASGVRFQWDLESYRWKGARDASRAQLLALIDSADRETFLQEVVGFTTFNKLPTLQRVLPLRHPLRPTLFCDEYELESYGAYETRTNFHDPTNPIDPAAPAQDWERYLLTFSRPRHRIFSDALLANPAFMGGPAEINKEQYRYTTVTEMPHPRNRRVSSLGFEYLKPDGTWAVVPDETQFVPDYQIDIVVTWLQVPVVAVPRGAILNSLNTVNLTPIRFQNGLVGGTTWFPGILAFKGLARPYEQYEGADGGLYYDLQYLFTAQPGGWNNYLTRDAAGNKLYRPIRIRAGGGAGFAPFVATEFQNLFVTA